MISSLSDVVPQHAEQGANDARWFLVEHLLIDAKMNVQIACDYLSDIIALPENANERGVATDCMDITRMMLRHILDHYATFLSYLSDTDVSERISQMEV